MTAMPRDFRLVDPQPIGDAELVASNIADGLPREVVALDYDAWDASSTYALNAEVCFIYDPSKDGILGSSVQSAARFGVFKSKGGSNRNYEPEKFYSKTYWREQSRADVYGAGTTYALNDLVFYTSGGFSGIYRSLAGSNTGNTPSLVSAWWTLETTLATVWNSATNYGWFSSVSRESGGTGYIFQSQLSGNVGHDPLGTETLPGAFIWTRTRDLPAWNATTTYGLGTLVGRIDSGSGAIYQSLKAGNVGKDPASEPDWWAQTSSNSYEAWASGTTYALDAVVCVFVLNRLGYVYRSLAGGNTNHPPGSSPDWWEFLGEAYADWDSGESYDAGETVTDPRTHRNYESAQDTNSNHDPTTDDGTWWIDLGATNRWRMFDEANGSQSSRGNVLDVTLRIAAAANTIALLEVDAEEVQVIITDGATTLFDQTYTLFERPGPAGWFTYLFAPFVNRRSVLVPDIYIPAGAEIRIIASYSGQAARIGNVLFGRAVAIGTTLLDAEVGIDDFSLPVPNSFGDLEIIERPYRRTAQMMIAVEPQYSDSVVEALAARRAKATLYIASNTYSSLLIYGFAKSWRGQMKYPTIHYFPLELYALT